jgi:RNA polymerase sigma-70 factor (ECF subfamily)
MAQPNHLIKRLKEKDQSAMAEFYDMYANAIYGVILRIVKKQHLAEEVLQDTYLKVWRNIDKYDSNVSNIYTWMYRIARNSALTTLNSKTEKKQSDIQNLDSSVYNIGDDSIAIKPEFMELKGLLTQLELKYRKVIELAYFEGYSQQDICKKLEIPLGTVKSRIKIGLRLLRKIYDQDDSYFNNIVAIIILVVAWI